ncbi:MAG: pilin [Candidatus Pacebacteria bacterium]|nr:pilin [Candidatus Paceibacterota bacterium]
MKHLQNKKIYVYGASLGLLILLPVLAYAQQETFIPLTPLPGVTSSMSFGDFLNTVFRIGLAIAATLAVVMITIGGIEYMTSEAVYGKTEGKERITNAVLGLLLALLIWVILYTINPNLINFDINVTPSGSTSSQNLESKTSKGGVGLWEFEGVTSSGTSVDQEPASEFGTGSGVGNQ